MKNRIIGIDPGYGRIGYGIIEGEGQDWKIVDYGCIFTDTKKSFSERLLDLENLLEEIIKKYTPNVASVEELFFAKNVTTGLQVAHARGVILLTLQKHNIKIFSCAPSQIKSAVTGNGHATKTQVQHMTKHLLSLTKKPVQDDSADALAAALACATSIKQKLF